MWDFVPSVLHILPRFHPVLDGVGDYALKLALGLRGAGKWESAFLVTDPGWSGPDRHEGFGLHKLSATSGPALAETLVSLRPETVLVHYVTYGYQPKGMPFWFQAGFDRWRQGAGRGARVVVLFHELWASGPPWSSACYSGLAQRWLVRRMLRAGDAAVTSNHRMRRMLDRIQPGKTALLPIPSSMPADGLARPPAGNRKTRLLVFGQEGQRLLSLRTHLGLIRSLAASDQLESVRVVGKGAAGGDQPSPDVALLRETMPQVPLVVVGNAGPEDVVRHFLESDLFLSGYPASLACKSSSLTTALACGCVPVMKDEEDSQPLVPGTHFLVCDGGPAAVGRLTETVRHGEWEAMSAAGMAWYREQGSWPVIAPRFDALLHPPQP